MREVNPNLKVSRLLVMKYVDEGGTTGNPML